MKDVLQFGIIGLGAGSLYALAAIGLVLVFRGSRVVNFAQGAMGMMAAYVFYEVHQNWHVTIVLALPAGLVASGAIGAAFYQLVIRRLRDSSNLIKITASLALLLVTQEAVQLIFGSNSRIVNSSLPTGSVSILGARVGADRLWIFGIVLVLTVALWAIYKFTRFGLATSAVAENPTSAAALAVNPDLIAVINWAVGAALGGLAAILLVPITSLDSASLSLLVVPILAAAVVGEFSSFPITTLAGLAMGVAQSEVTRYVSSPGWDTAVPFIFVTVILYFRGQTVVGRGEYFGRPPSIGSGRVSVWNVAIPVLAVMACIWFLFPFDWVAALQYQLTFAVILMSFVVITGYAGQVSLAQMGFAGIGALIASWLFSSYGVPFELAIIAGVIATVPVSLVVALAGVRTRGVSLAIVTLGLAFSLEAVVFTNSKYTGGELGFDTDNASFFGIHIGGLEYPARYATFTLIILVLVGLAVANLRRGAAGRRLIAVRTNERAAAAMGISVQGAKVYAFVLSGMIAAVGGILLVFDHPTPDFTNFAGFFSVILTETSVLGGVGHIGGPVAASAYQQTSVTTQVFSFVGGNVSTYLTLAGGVLLLLFISKFPDGQAAQIGEALGPMLEPLRSRLLWGSRPTSAVPAVASLADRRVSQSTLTLESVSVSFGGTRALDGLSLEVRGGEVVGLIGPNGAGKTTAIDVITGFVSPSDGHVMLDGVNISGWSPDRRARAGLGRSFQSLELFEDLTVLENLQSACDGRDRAMYVRDLARPRSKGLTAAAETAIRDFKLEPHLSTQVRHLSYAQRRLLAVARAVASGAPILLLDEPASGLSDREATELSDTIREIAATTGAGVLLIEHNVDMVLRTCDRIVALDFGREIGDGTPDEIRSNPAVVEAYLGAAHSAPSGTESAT